MTHKSRKNSCFEVLDGLFCELEASSVTWTYFMEAQGQVNCIFWSKKSFFFFSAVIFFQFFVIKALDPDWIQIGSGSGSVKNEYGSETLLKINKKNYRRVASCLKSCKVDFLQHRKASIFLSFSSLSVFLPLIFLIAFTQMSVIGKKRISCSRFVHRLLFLSNLFSGWH